MKRILILIILVISLGCSSNDNQGYGYQQTSAQSSENRIASRRNAIKMELKGTDGYTRNSCTAFKGEYDGHTWYVFFDNLAVPAVVHDPLCKCQERWK